MIAAKEKSKKEPGAETEAPELSSKSSKSSEQAGESFMSEVLGGPPSPPALGDLVEGKVLGFDKAILYVDLSPFGTGVIYGREYLNARDIIKNVSVGDHVAAKVVDPENADGYIELSLKEARQALIWGEAEEAIKEKKIFELPVKDANKGGLIIEWQGLTGFLPASQLKSEHYPRVADGDKDKIHEELRKFIGTKLLVSIIAAAPKEGKLIFSEKSPDGKEKEKIIGKYSVGEVVEGVVTGTVDFGVFIKIEEGLEGLVHISEIDWALVENPKALFRIGETVKVKIIEIKDGKVSLSIKALKENPWREAEKKYKKGDVVEGVIIKFNRHGALASIEEGVAGLVHISEFGSEEKLREKLELGKRYTFKIVLFDPKEQKMALSFVDKDKSK
ncbi:MAG: S1 RNA-binding domain-containing protein [Candidatus Taylorbacteria bacterium]|nr:S1 RNA-binding domain-containing protein [Candidatus Taylorbacteria bacterium]